MLAQPTKSSSAMHQYMNGSASQNGNHFAKQSAFIPVPVWFLV